MKYMDFSKKINSDSLKNVYVISGEDCFFRDNAVEKVLQNANIQNKELNVVRYGEENFDDFIISLNQIPFLSDNRCSIYSASKLLDNQKKQIEKYANNPNPTSIAIVTLESPTEIKLAENIDCKRENELIISKWIEIKFKQQKIYCPSNICKELAQRCNRDMSVVANTVEMLSAYKYVDGKIDMEDLEYLAPSIAEEEIFKIINAVVEKDVKKAFVGINKVKFTKEETKSKKIDSKVDESDETQKTEIIPTKAKGKKQNRNPDLGVLSMLYGSYRRMFYVLTSKKSTSDIANVLGVKEYSIIKAKELANKYTIKGLRYAMKIIGEAENNIKSGVDTSKNIVEDVVIRLMV